MATGTFYPAASGDDGFAIRGFDSTSVYMRMGKATSYAYGLWVRFQNVTIPTGKVITEAYVRFTARYARDTADCNLNIYFNDADDAVAPINGTGYDALDLTDAVSWNSVGSWIVDAQYNSPDLKTILQDIIDRPGWSSSNAVQVLVKDNASAYDSQRLPASYDYSSGAHKAELHVTFEDPSVTCPEPFSSESSLLATIEPSWDEIICPSPFSAQSFLLGSPTIEVNQSLFASTGSLYMQPEFQIFTGGLLSATGSISATITDPFSVAILPRVYTFTLTGAADRVDDIVIPVKSFQSRLKSGDPTYLSVVIPGIDYASEINLRLNGDLVVRMGYLSNGEIILAEIISMVNFENIIIYNGTTNKTITLDGHRTETFISKEINLTGSSYKNLTAGKLRYRCTPNLYVRPGDKVNIDDDSFTIKNITYSVSPELETFEVSE